MAENVSITAKSLKKYIGKNIYLEQSDGKRLEGRLVAIKNGKVYMKPLKTNNDRKPVKTSFFFIGLWIIGILAVVGIGLLLWCACCGSRVRGHGGCGCGCRRRPYRARRPYKTARNRAGYRRVRYA